jgi:hypothetical protein
MTSDGGVTVLPGQRGRVIEALPGDRGRATIGGSLVTVATVRGGPLCTGDAVRVVRADAQPPRVEIVNRRAAMPLRAPSRPPRAAAA